MTETTPSSPTNRRPWLWIILIAVLILIALVLLLNLGGLGQALLPASSPTVSILQPGGPQQLASGDSLVVVADSASSAGIARLVLMADGKLAGERRFSPPQESAQAAFAWFATSLGAHELSVVAYDANGQASAPAALQISVDAPESGALQGGAVVVNEQDSPAADQAQAERAEHAGLPADGDIPVNNAAEAANDEAGANEDAAPADQADQPADQPAAEGDEDQAPAEDQAEQPAGDEGLQPGPGEDNAPPTADLIVNVERNAQALVATIIANGEDDFGLDFLRVSISGPAGENQVMVFPCHGAVECGFSFSYALGSSGEWVFHLQAFDLVPQASEAAVTTRQILCQGGGAQPDCSIVERDDPLGGILDGIIEAQGELWRQLLDGVVLNPIDLAQGFVLGDNADAGQNRDESFEVRGCLIVQPVNINNPPNGPVTECPEYNLSGEDLSELDLRGADFERADMRQVNLRGSQLLWANLFATDLRGADLSNARIGRAELRLALLSGSTLNGASLNYAFLSGAQMQEIVGAHLDMGHAAMVEADLSGASLPSARFDSANLTGANLAGTVLQHASFVGANLEGANLVGADLTDAEFTGANLFRANFRPENGQLPGGLVHGITWSNTTCPDGTNSDDNGGQCAAANLAPYAIAGCVIVIDNQYPDGPQSDCSGLDMTAADFEGRDLRGADFTGTNLTAADMRQGDFRFADFTDANLLGAQAFGAVYGGATWSNTTCPDGSNSDDHNNTCEGFLFP